MNHKWNNSNVCANCGVEREMRKWKRRMAIFRGRDVYQYGKSYFYSGDGKTWNENRPDCLK